LSTDLSSIKLASRSASTPIFAIALREVMTKPVWR
jgi:hypothetical protein